MNQKKVYKNYPPEFKEEAVALVTEQSYSVSEAAESLGIRANQLYSWKAKLEASKQDSQLSNDERAELNRLRKENKTLRIEKEILKKASVDSTCQFSTSFNNLFWGIKFQCFSRSVI